MKKELKQYNYSILIAEEQVMIVGKDVQGCPDQTEKDQHDSTYDIFILQCVNKIIITYPSFLNFVSVLLTLTQLKVRYSLLPQKLINLEDIEL